jgi:hypothetical protein
MCVRAMRTSAWFSCLTFRKNDESCASGPPPAAKYGLNSRPFPNLANSVISFVVRATTATFRPPASNTLWSTSRIQGSAFDGSDALLRLVLMSAVPLRASEVKCSSRRGNPSSTSWLPIVTAAYLRRLKNSVKGRSPSGSFAST